MPSLSSAVTFLRNFLSPLGFLATDGFRGPKAVFLFDLILHSTFILPVTED